MVQLLTAEEVAETLRVSRARVYELARSGTLPAVRLGRQTRFHPDQVRDFIEGGGQPLPGGWRREVA